MAVYKRGDHYYVDVYYGKGQEQRRYRKYVGTSYREAVKAEAGLVARIGAGDYTFLEPPKRSMPLSQFCEAYLEKWSAVNKSVSTVLRDRVILSHFAGYFGTTAMSTITPEQMSAYMKHRMTATGKDPNAHKRRSAARGPSPRTVSASTVNRELGVIGNLFRVARRWGYCSSNPMEGIKKLKVKEIHERYLTPEEGHRLVAAARESVTRKLPAFVLLALHTGMRRGELLRLRWDQVDFAHRTVTVVQEKTGYKKSVPLDNTAMEALRELVRDRARRPEPEASPHLFKNDETEKPYVHLNKAFRNALKRAGITRPFAIKDLRHTAATWMRQKGVDIATIKDILGHRSIVTTMRYAHIGRDDLARSVQVLDTVWSQGVSVEKEAETEQAVSSGNAS